MSVPDRSHILTEQVSTASEKLEVMSIAEAVAVMQEANLQAARAVGERQKEIAIAVELVAKAFESGGRLIYFGAGTSGRLGVLDASECPPTFCSEPGMVVGVIAGGDEALRRSIENVEDDRDAGARIVREMNVAASDVVFGIAAGGTTPFVHGALAEGKLHGAKTVFLICTDPAHVAVEVDLMIALLSGAEVLTGSTRLKAGTATKMALNMVTTLAMVRIGKTFGNLMVDIDAMKNAKLVDRALRMISTIAKVDRAAAGELLTRAGGKVKRAIVMHRWACAPTDADARLADAGGRLRAAIA